MNEDSQLYTVPSVMKSLPERTIWTLDVYQSEVREGLQDAY